MYRDENPYKPSLLEISHTVLVTRIPRLHALPPLLCQTPAPAALIRHITTQWPTLWTPAAYRSLGAARRAQAKLNTLADLFLSSRSTVFFTGAGVSTNAGISDYRGPTGAWTNQPSTSCAKRKGGNP